MAKKGIVIIKGDKLPPNPNGALTLVPSQLGRHDDGWEIIGRVHEDYFEWINSFVAYNHKDWPYSWVAGDFEEEVVASSQEAYDDFVSKYPPSAWDYWDI